MQSHLTHINDRGEAEMVDVGGKDATTRVATASGSITMRPETLALIRDGSAKKGDVIAIARIAAIMAAKRTHDLIPLCHPLPLTKVSVSIELNDTLPGIDVSATCHVTGRTGVEMEALTSVSVACLTIYDMVKAVDRGMIIGHIRLVSKTGGNSGTWQGT